MTAKNNIRNKATLLGSSHCGFAQAIPLESQTGFYSDFIRKRCYADLDYLQRYANYRMNPEQVFPGVKTVISLLMNYFPHSIIPEEDNFIISKYAYGKDNHVVMKERIQQMVQFLTGTFPPCRAQGFFDSAKVMEKFWAQRCGVGWQGKNTLIIHKDQGSYFHIGIIFTDLEVDPDQPESDHCGNCEACRRACPTGALHTPYQLDIIRCLAYHTIENRSEIPEGVQGKFHDRIYGCDICQDTCPYNRFARSHKEPDFLPSQEMVAMRKKEWLAMDEVMFNRLFKHSSVSRTGFLTLKRNMHL